VVLTAYYATSNLIAICVNKKQVI